jgi:GDPmannose 4,6-dehydratase
MANKKVALLTGITGQDGAYLANLLLQKGYEVHGIKRTLSASTDSRPIGEVPGGIAAEQAPILHSGDLTDGNSLMRVVERVQPDEIYNLAAISHIPSTMDAAEYTANVDGLGVLRLLEAIRTLHLEKKTRFFQASSSELFGRTQQLPQTEMTPFYPRNPYGVAKLYGYWITVNYREMYGMYACNGIMFNHESPIRGEIFVTRKITRALTRISFGLQQCLYLGNMGAVRDWGHARDFVEMQWLMLQQPTPEDFVIATGVHHTVRQFVGLAAQALGIELRFEGNGVDEVGIVVATDSSSKCKAGDVIVRVDAQFYRGAEPEIFLGDVRKAREKLGWQPRTDVAVLAREMIDFDVLQVRRHELPASLIR